MGLTKKRGFSRKFTAVLVILLILGACGWGTWRHFAKHGSEKTNVIRSRVMRGTFVHDVAGKGSAQSAKNVDISCQVETNGGTTIIWIVPEGDQVAKGDKLVVLDSSDLEDKASTQQITCNTNSATVASSQASLRTAELSLEEYIEGTFEQNWMTIENDIYAAREEQKQGADSVAYTKKLVQFGYTTMVQLESALVAEQKQVNALKNNLLKQTVLLKYTSEKEITKLMADIETARAKLSSDTYSAEVAKNRLDHYLQQLESCVVRAPTDGQVVYANEDVRRESDMIREGSNVFANQVMVRLPDPMHMQVKALINESNIANVKVGMKAKIVFDALSSHSFEGTVSKVNQYPEFVWMSSAKDYVTIIDIDNPSNEIRSGLTAQVQIEASRIPDVLMLPVQCIVEVAKKNYVITYEEGKWDYKEVKLGISNDKQVIIEEGLSEGDRVVSGARKYKNKVKLPGMPVKDQNGENVKPGDGILNPELQNQNSSDAPAGENGPADGFPGGGQPPAGGMPGVPTLGGPMPAGGPPMGTPNPGGPMPGAGSGAPPFAMGGTPAPKSGESAEEENAEDSEKNERLISYFVQIIKDGETAEYQKLESLKPYFDLTAMEFCQKADINSDKTITREELTEVLPLSLPFFEAWDRNSKGTLTRTDMVIGFCSSRIHYQKMGKIIEEDADSESNDIKFVLRKDPSEIFNFLDLTHDSAIDSADQPENDHSETFSELIKRFDENGDGKINADEFSKGITRLKQDLGQGHHAKGNGNQNRGNMPPPPPR